MKEMTTNFGKLDKIEGHDFRRWQKKMHFLLTTLKVFYVLTTPMPELVKDATVEAIRIRAKWKNEDYICRGHILNDDLSLVQLGSHLRIEESLRAQDGDKGKGKEVGGPSVNMIEEARLITSKGIAVVVKRITEMLVVRERGLRTNPKTKVDAIAWWIDSSATTHVCKDRCWFKTFEPVEDGSVLYTGAEHFAHVHGKGSVALEFSFGKIVTLFNVLCVPKLRKKLVSIPVLNKCGYKQDEALDKFRIYKTEVELKQNDLNKTLRKDRGGEYYDPVFFQSVGIIHETTAPYTPQQNGVAERKNRAIKEMGCRAMVRLPDSKRKTLNEKGIDCNFVGYVEHSKAYRFYVIESNDSISINSIIEARDAIFDENRFSSIPRPKDIIPNVQESQMDDHTDALDKRKGYAPVVRITTIRLLLALAAIHNLVIHQMDSKIAFLNGDLDEEVYMKQPEGFCMPDNEHKVSDVILGIKIKRENKRIVITQSRYIEKTLKKFNREDCSPVSTPMDPVEKLKPNTGKPVDQLEYSRVIGCLMYVMTSIRPDIAYVVGRLSRFTSNPSRQHWKEITKVFKYLRGTKDYGLSYVGYPSMLEGYSDASWINHVEDSSSTSGWVFLIRRGSISWASKKQTCITGSTMESEFVALVAAGKEAEWLRNLIHEIPIWPKPIAPISIRCDSAPTMARAYSQIYNGKSRHLGVKHSMVRELIRNDVISVEFVRTQHNLADHLTNGLARDLVYKSVIGMGLKSI
uniref:Zinc finger, CCHC-type n=1 Tax=Tanacetum cinerariifolium TaxID=118510 RepID=A0A699I3E5_TANCI|nr:zinc finger, CCHC-type [Tanacetum cinerariifolium]